MSTYTDLHTRNKENITVFRMPGNPFDGMTSQKVNFANPENVYNGKFIGDLSIAGGSFNNVEISGCTIVDAVLENATFKYGNLSVTVKQLTTDYSELTEEVKAMHSFQTSVEMSCASLSAAMSGYLSLSGGDILGDLSVLSGNYIQTSTPENVYVYGSNSFIQAESTAKYGSASIGSRGFIVIGVVSAENKVILSVDGLSNVNDCIPESCYTSTWSIALDNYLDAQFSEISTVGADYVIFKNALKATASYDGKELTAFIDLLNKKDDNALYCPTHPEVGNLVIPTFTSNHSEGGSTHATAQFAHAEGRYTFAEGRYSHAEGHGTLAAGTGAHVEGMGSKALHNHGVHAEGYYSAATGDYGSHAEGISCIASGAEGSHAEGFGTTAKGKQSHAEGASTHAYGTGSHAEGYQTEANEYATHAEGFKSKALSAGAHAEGGGKDGSNIYRGGYAAGLGAHAEGRETSALGGYSHAEGFGTYASGSFSHTAGYQTSAFRQGAYAEGYRTQALSDWSHVEGYMTSAYAECAHAEGGSKISALVGGYAKGVASHAEGVQTSAIGDWSHAEGRKSRAEGVGAHAEGGSLTYVGGYAKGVASHAEGAATHAIGSFSHAEGYQTSAFSQGTVAFGHNAYISGDWSFGGGYDLSSNAKNTVVLGINANANDLRSYVWSGIASSVPYTSHGVGTFNVNPMNSISGFYIGTENLASYLDQKQDKLSGKSLQIIDPTITLFKVQATFDYNKSGIYSAERDDISKPIVIDWGDGTVEQVNGDVSQKVHTYATVGEFEVTISNVKTFAASANDFTWYGTTSLNRYTLKEVTLGSSVTSIGTYAFNNCNSLTSVTIPDSVTSIGSDAFQACGLMSVTIGNSVTSIGRYAFSNCSGLMSVTIPDSVTNLENGVFIGCYGLTSVTIGDGVTSIGYRTFDSCRGLTSVMIGSNVTSIGERAFYYCNSLTSVTIPDNVTSIRGRAFEGCSELTSVTIGDGVTSIGSSAFSSCTNLAKIIFKNRQLSQIPSGSPWSAPSTTMIETWNDASQEWVSSQISANLTSADISATYADQHIYLSAKGQVVGNIDCSDFIKDGMLSTVELCSDQLIFSFNTDSAQDAISVALSNFIDETQYWTKSETSSATEISNALSAKADMSSISKVFIKDPSIPAYADGKQSDLSIVKLSSYEQYAQILQDGADPSTLYILSGSYINAYGQQIRNVADGTLSSDAVTLNQLNAISAQLSVQNTIVTALSSAGLDNSTLLSNITLSNVIEFMYNLAQLVQHTT